MKRLLILAATLALVGCRSQETPIVNAGSPEDKVMTACRREYANQGVDAVYDCVLRQDTAQLDREERNRENRVKASLD